ncbi:hypothetical protein ACET3Z_019214 [Daucus carota]
MVFSRSLYLPQKILYEQASLTGYRPHANFSITSYCNSLKKKFEDKITEFQTLRQTIHHVSRVIDTRADRLLQFQNLRSRS